ncbi:hypothetical protein, partial [Mesorhizobium sp. M0053]|uniref:hypothetical protein n=1 Tax=Mesorhizobium sp. M0053 TaxID=2956864 RepID=UPI00333C7689
GSVDTIRATDIDYLQLRLVSDTPIIGEDAFENRLGPIWNHIVHGQTSPKINVRPPAIVGCREIVLRPLNSAAFRIC